ncbi:MAG: DUF3048 C-terminal domain-containing protein [Pelolinea sp.]|nr:DUF3048 C-terminal domain-containing protein [Pelolinea sp.]
MNVRKFVLITIIATMALTSCQLRFAQPTTVSKGEETASPSVSSPAPELTSTPVNQDTKVLPTSEPVETHPTVETPTGEAITLNPLTGLPVQNPENLLLPPALISVTNFPPTARPQAGLSFSPIVFELFIGEGMTRYLALFYGDYPRASLPDQGEDVQDDLTKGLPLPVVGPVRSGRLPYEHIRKLYNGFIVMASAYSKVAAQLKDYVNVYGDDNMDVNSALMPVDQLVEVAKANQKDLGEMNLSGMAFDTEPPDNGKKAQSLWVFYAYKNQIFWRYNEEDGSYHRWQDNADGSTFIEQTDRLNGEPLTYENVVVLFADHEVQNITLIDINLLYVKRGKALLFRDGVMQEIYWTTISEEYEKTTGRLRPIRFVDAKGNQIAFKPGQTWVEIVPNHIAYWETVNSEKYNQLASGRSKGSGYWGVYFKLDN